MGSPSYSEWLKANPQIAQQALASRGGVMPNLYGVEGDSTVVASMQPQEPVLPPVQEAPPPAPVEAAPAQELGPVAVEEQGPPPVDLTTPVVMNAEAPRGRPAQALAQLQGQRVDNANAMGASHIREGEVKAQAAEQSASEVGAFIDKAKDRTARAEANHDANREKSDKYKRYLDEDLEELRKPILQENGYQKSVGIVSGIVAAMAQQNGGAGNAGLAAGMGMLNQHAHRNITQQLQERDQRSENFKRNQQAIATLSKDSSDELDIANKLMANQHLVMEAQLQKIGEETKSPAARETAFRLATGQKDEADKYLEAIMMSKIKSGRVKGTDWDKIPTPVLQAAGANLPLDGQRALELRLEKKAKDELAEENTRSEIAKREQEGPGKVTAEAAKLGRMIDATKPDATSLRRYVNSGEEVPYVGVRGMGKISPDATTPTENIQFRNSVNTIAMAALRDESGAAISDQERESKLEAYGVFNSDPVVAKAGLAKLMADYDARASSVGRSTSALPPEVVANMQRLGIKKRGP